MLKRTKRPRKRNGRNRCTDWTESPVNGGRGSKHESQQYNIKKAPK